MILMQIGERIDKVELSKFIEVLDHFSHISQNKMALIENKSSIIWFIKIYKATKEENIQLSIFNRLI